MRKNFEGTRAANGNYPIATKILPSGKILF